ncbi:MAG: MFS transporter [Anaerolineae bacterium]|nr:MFS transporter [Anaerolineae bacterium]
MSDNIRKPTGMTAFIIIWIGQVLSLLGTAISNYGVRFWIYEAIPGQATPFTLIAFFFTLPMVVLTPIVGVLVDRHNRKLMMMLSDLAAALTTLILLILYVTGHLQVWHLYFTAFISGTFQGFQWPAYSAAISTMLDKKDYARAGGMLEMVGPASFTFAPMIAAAIIGPLGIVIRNMFGPAFISRLSGEPGLLALLVIDLISASFAIGSLLFVHIPQPEQSESGKQAEGNFVKQALFGFRYIAERPSLLGLQLVFLLGNLFSSLGYAVYDPMILARTGGDKLVFGSIQTIGAIGGVMGGLAMGAWGGFKKRVHGVLLGWALTGASMYAMGVANAFLPWMIIAFISSLFGPLINASNQAIWQSKVPPDIQGRVFASRRLIAWMVSPVSLLVAGPLADEIFEPGMQLNGGLHHIFGWMVGSGSGAGMALQFALAGLFALVIGMGGYLFKVIRHAEELLPDHDALRETTPETS